jgi:hypothetical protein
MQEGSIKHGLIEKEAYKQGFQIEVVSTEPILHTILRING